MGCSRMRRLRGPDGARSLVSEVNVYVNVRQPPSALSDEKLRILRIKKGIAPGHRLHEGGGRRQQLLRIEAGDGDAALQERGVLRPFLQEAFRIGRADRKEPCADRRGEEPEIGS